MLAQGSGWSDAWVPGMRRQVWASHTMRGEPVGTSAEVPSSITPVICCPSGSADWEAGQQGTYTGPEAL